MITWLVQHIATLLICFVLILIVVGILFVLRRDRKNGKSSCGGNCGACGHACSELYPHSKEFLEKYKSSKSNQINSCRN